MSSDQFGRGSSSKGLSSPPSSGGPPSGDRTTPSGDRPPPSSSNRPPADFVAWGAVRDAITSIHNLEALLKSPRVGTKVLADVLHEFITGIGVLREAFARAAGTAKDERSMVARGALAEFTRQRLDELEQAMKSALSTDFDARGRLGLEHVVMRVSIDLDAAAELLDLSERGEHAVTTDLSLDELARVSMRGVARGTDREIPVRLARAVGDCLLRADPHVFKRLVAFAVARVHAAGAKEATVRAVRDGERAGIEVGPTRPAEEPLPPSQMRLVRRIDPTDAVVEAAARTAGIDLDVSGAWVSLSAMTIER